MQLDEIKKTLKEFCQRPLKTILLLLVAVGVIVFLAFVSAWGSKKGEQAAVISGHGVVKEENHIQSGYVLAADINVQDDYVRIEGLTIKGDVNYVNTKGSSLEDVWIFQNQEGQGGNFNVQNSEIGNVNKNWIKGNVNVSDSKVSGFDKNVLGE